jgi:hypothetical protein
MTTATHAPPTILQPPALDIDAKLGKPNPRGKIERRVVWNLLKHLEARGFFPILHCDGEEDVRVKGDHKRVMELTFNLDECRIYFAADPQAKLKDGAGSVLIILGNGEDCITDWSWNLGEDDGPFNKAMTAFDAEDYA